MKTTTFRHRYVTCAKCHCNTWYVEVHPGPVSRCPHCKRVWRASDEKRYTFWQNAKARLFEGRISGPLVTLAMVAVVAPLGVLGAVAGAVKERFRK